MRCRFSVASPKQGPLCSGLYHFAIMAHKRADSGEKLLGDPISILLLIIFSIQTSVTISLVCTCKRIFPTSGVVRNPDNPVPPKPSTHTSETQYPETCKSRCYNPFKYAHRLGLYLSFHLSCLIGPFVHGMASESANN